MKARCKAGETEMSTRGNQDVPPVDTNDNQLIRINNDIIVRVKKEEFEVAVLGKAPSLYRKPERKFWPMI